jgi:ferric-dicitrate binding protein FerR (iron transport regulator)
MVTDNQQELRPGEEQALEGLLREMAPVAEPAPEVRERIRAVVAAEWRTAVAPVRAAPVRRWQRPALGVAAGLAAAAVALAVYQSGSPEPAPVVARLSRQSGEVEAGAAEGWLPVSAGQALTAGQKLVTGRGGRAALALPRGVTLRLDTDTRITLAGIDRVIVERGAVYLDSGQRPAPGPGVQIDSAFGSTRHLGTQYEVRVNAEQMVVSVREGLVAVDGSGAARSGPRTVARAGEQLAVQGSGAIARSTVDKRDPRWNWIAGVTPPFAIEDRPLSEFLAWVCRETGRELAYDSPAVEATAGQIVLRGSVAGLSPEEALTAVMATTNLTYSDDDGRLVVRAAVHQATTR